MVIDSASMRRRMLPYMISGVGAASGPRARGDCWQPDLLYIATRASWRAHSAAAAPSLAGR